MLLLAPLKAATLAALHHRHSHQSPPSLTGRATEAVSGFAGRRHFLAAAAVLAAAALPNCGLCATDDGLIAAAFGDGRLGLELMDVQGGAAIKVILIGGAASKNKQLRAGLRVLSVAGEAVSGLTAKEVAKRISAAPRPVTITFASATAPAAATAAAAAAAEPSQAEKAASTQQPAGSLNVQRVRAAQDCAVKTRVGDLIEIRFSARLASDLAIEFDSSDGRGTGLPYQMVVGNGDVVRGLDLALYDMCIGERRRVEVPAGLGYGDAGSKAFGVPPGAALVYGVELVTINGQGNPAATRGSNFYTGDPCSEEAAVAGIASGRCAAIFKD